MRRENTFSRSLCEESGDAKCDRRSKRLKTSKSLLFEVEIQPSAEANDGRAKNLANETAKQSLDQLRTS
jgi:hypothetical protein